ncbi:unnamed protein product [Aphanomyces euteiches]|nr:hypothetical protein Ae201684P_009884 [Aphanomyces euteiches]
MYKSKFDDKLEFEFDPLRELHKDNAALLRWHGFPYKQKVIDRVVQKVPGATVLKAAGALLSSCGVEANAVAAFRLCHSPDQWANFEKRFKDEQAAFVLAKAMYIRDSSAKLRQAFQEADARAELKRQVDEVAAKNATIKVMRYDNGDKYEGQVHDRHGVLIPHGQGTLFVRDVATKDDPLATPTFVPRYRGMWMNGLMHGPGRYQWDDGSSWDGTFLLNELNGKGIFCNEPEVEDDDEFNSSPKPSPLVRYYYRGEHVCWGSELAHNSRIRIYHSQGSTTSARSTTNVHSLAFPYTDGCIAEYDAKTDRHRLAIHGKPDQWVDLNRNIHFQLLSANPLGPFLFR